MKVGPLTLADAMLLIDPDCSVEDLEWPVQNVFWMLRNANWWAGDALVFGEARFGDDIWQCVPEWMSEKQCERLMRQSSKVKPSSRVAEVSWTHHSYVQKVSSPILQRSLLSKAATEKMDSEQFRLFVDRNCK